MSCELLKKLNIKITSPYWEEAYESAVKEPAVPEWLTEDYLKGLDGEYGIFPKNLGLLIEAAKKTETDYAVDVYPHYGSDVEATLRGGHDIRHGLIGPGVYASHGYERSHIDGVYNTLKLLWGYLDC